MVQVFLWNLCYNANCKRVQVLPLLCCYWAKVERNWSWLHHKSWGFYCKLPQQMGFRNIILWIFTRKWTTGRKWTGTQVCILHVEVVIDNDHLCAQLLLPYTLYVHIYVHVCWQSGVKYYTVYPSYIEIYKNAQLIIN